MIARCKCGRMKTVTPFNNAAERPWKCDTCGQEEREKRKAESDARRDGLQNNT